MHARLRGLRTYRSRHSWLCGAFVCTIVTEELNREPPTSSGPGSVHQNGSSSGHEKSPSAPAAFVAVTHSSSPSGADGDHLCQSSTTRYSRSVSSFFFQIDSSSSFQDENRFDPIHQHELGRASCREGG